MMTAAVVVFILWHVGYLVVTYFEWREHFR